VQPGRGVGARSHKVAESTKLVDIGCCGEGAALVGLWRDVPLLTPACAKESLVSTSVTDIAKKILCHNRYYLHSTSRAVAERQKKKKT